jgi:hypothetical protein
VLLVSRRSWTALFVPVLFTAMAGVFLTLSVAALASHASVGRAVGVAVSLGLAIAVVSDVRVIFALDGMVRVRSLFDRGDFDARVCSFTVTVVRSARGGPSYNVYAGDGEASARTKVSFHFTKAGAGRAVRRLGIGVLGRNAQAARAEEDAVLATLLHEHRANLAKARAHMSRPTRWARRVPWIFAIIAALVTTAAFLMNR